MVKRQDTTFLEKLGGDGELFPSAVTGLVVLGQRWQQERWQLLQLMWQSSISSEKLSRVLEPLSRLKGVIVRGNPQASLVRSGTSSEI
ncbi:unnamed protein product [Brassica oleracea var. botrytis]|uniref:Uncharacterized protein n=3 Tax=Brassica TaxID=3705 RepID=A0A0D3BQ85_BRAOL|nr:unnamed protein product [Brassica napus]CDY18884.1 BnaC04g04660D [Brassica napus]VDD05038.1 unnamed protein product [Brassica oleracea]